MYEPHHKVWRERDRSGRPTTRNHPKLHGAIARHETAWSLLCPPCMRALPFALALVAAGACAGYRPGSFTMSGEPFVGELTTAGCLDLAVDVGRDPVAAGPVVQYQFGNRCDRAQTIDLGAVHVTGRTRSGEEVAMVAYDPLGEIRPLPLDARGSGRERIEYRTRRDFSGDVVAVCVAIGEVGGSGGEPAPLATTCRAVATTEPVVAEVTP
jgi:hypothetical protein